MSSRVSNRPRRSSLAVPALVALVALACNFGRALTPTPAVVLTRTPPTAAAAHTLPPALPSPTAPPAATSTAAATVGPVEEVILLDVLHARLRAGADIAERGALIAEALRYLLGEGEAETLVGSGQAVTHVGATGLLRLAEHYLALEGADPTARAEIETLFNRLLPPEEVLAQYVRPAPSPAAAAGSQRDARPPAQGDEELCAALWREGFTDPGGLICFEFATRTIDGQEHRVFYPSYWAADDPRRAYLTLYLEALDESLAVFNRYGPAPVKPVVMVFTELALLTERGRDDDVYAAAGRSRSGRTCRMGVFPSAVAQDPPAFKQTVAHELFHCWQYTNLDAQEGGPDPDSNLWWVEGSAEFFGSVVYPAVNDEWQFVSDFDEQSPNHSLLDMSYPNVLWFQYLAHGAGLGADGVLGLLRGMPTSGGYAEQEAALAAFPSIEDHFHNFGRAYLDRALIDLSGAVVPVNPLRGMDNTFAVGGGDQPYQPLPFYLTRYQLHWQEDARFALTVTTLGEGRSAVRALDAPGLWSALPDALNTACDAVTHLLLVTTTESGDADPHELNVAYTGEAADGCDSCLVGDWQLVNESYVAFLAALTRPEDRLRYTAATGATIFTFKDDGTSRTRHEGFALGGVIHQEALDGSALDLPLTMTLRGGSEARYTAAEGVLTFSGTAFSVTADMNLNGVALNDFVFNAEDFGLGAGEARYTCLGNTMTYRPIFPGRETTRSMEFMRIEGP